jgi:acyl-CoA hydrolase
MIDTEKYQPARQNMKLVTSSPCSLANKPQILARQADIFGINQFTSR